MVMTAAVGGGHGNVEGPKTAGPMPRLIRRVTSGPELERRIEE